MKEALRGRKKSNVKLSNLACHQLSLIGHTASGSAANWNQSGVLP